MSRIKSIALALVIVILPTMAFMAGKHQANYRKSDAQYVADYCVGFIILDESEKKFYDANKDGAVTISDACEISRIIGSRK